MAFCLINLNHLVDRQVAGREVRERYLDRLLDIGKQVGR